MYHVKGERRDIAYLYVYAIAVGLIGLGLTILGTQAIVGFISGGMWLNNEEIDGYLIHRKLHFNVLIRQFSYVIAFKTLIIGRLLALGAFLVIDRQITLGQFVAAELIVVQVIG